MSQPDIIINCNLNSEHATREHTDSNKYIFETHDTLNLSNTESYISVVDFQALHSIFNINSENNEFMGRFIEAGHYLCDELVTVLNELILEIFPVESQFQVRFSKNTLKFYFVSVNISFTLSGSILNILNIQDGSVSSLIEEVNMISSTKPCDILENFHNLNIVLKGVKSRNIAVENDDAFIGNKICRVPIPCKFGEYIMFHNSKDSRNRIYEKIINSFEILILNDDNKPILTDTKFSMTLKIEVYNNNKEPEEEEKIYIASLTDTPVIINKIVSFKDARETYEEDMLKKKKRYLEDHPLYNFDLLEIEKNIKKFKKIKKGIVKKNKNN
jgi:hypothetical protein